MLGNNIPTYLRQNYDKFCQTLLILLGILSLAWSLGANPASLVQEKPNALSISPTAISFNWFELFKNAIRYVQVSNISEQEEVEIGKLINQKLLTQQYKLHHSSQIQKYADILGQELVASSNSRNIPYTFQVVMGEEVNAFATPGGFVYLTTGLLKEADNQAQLASAIAHEIAHINQKHHLKALKQAVLAQGIAETAGINTHTLAQIGYQLAIELPQSREDEYEADRIGLEILRAAGYSPLAFVNFLKQLEAKGTQPEFLRTHPTSANRIEALTQEIESTQISSHKGQSQAAYRNNVLSLL
ncbi:MAG: M48 family metallopeptidase [Xenococcaceae cyanobacterium]